jgi:hypothetical protein
MVFIMSYNKNVKLSKVFISLLVSVLVILTFKLIIFQVKFKPLIIVNMINIHPLFIFLTYAMFKLLDILIQFRDTISLTLKHALSATLHSIPIPTLSIPCLTPKRSTCITSKYTNITNRIYITILVPFLT